MVTGGRSAEVRFEELHQLLRLASDLRDLPAGSEAQRREALRGLGALVGAEVGLWLEVEGTDTGQPVLLRAIDVGFAGERERRAFLAYLNDDQEGCSDPALARIARVARAPVFAVTRAELLDDRTWYASEHVQRYRRAAGVDGFIYAAASPSPGGAAQCISLHRPWGERPFSERERRLVEAFWRECAWLHAAPAPAPPESAIPANLPQRLRDTLRGLVRGLSEKQLADELGISPHTVHDYVKALHRRFHVRSRGELLALHLTRAAPAPRAGRSR